MPQAMQVYSEQPGLASDLGGLSSKGSVQGHEESIRHFVDIASHELRTPLSIIKGYADASPDRGAGAVLAYSY